MLIGTDGVYSYTFEHEKRKDCPVCGGEAVDMTLKPDATVEQLIDILVEKQDMYVSLFSSVFCCGSPSTLDKSNQEALSIHWGEAYILPSTTTAGASDATQLGEENI